MKKTILIIEDDISIQKLLTVTLKKMEYELICTSNALDGYVALSNSKIDLVLLDLGLPDIDGLLVLKRVREVSKVPIIVVSARFQEQDKVEALDNGADDYIVKPFNTKELLARIRVAFRHYSINGEQSDNYTNNGLYIDYTHRYVSVDDVEVHVTPIEYKILKLLSQNAGKVLTHAYIHNEVWGYENYDDFQALRVFLTNIRRKLNDNFSNPKYIMTEIGVGYRMRQD